jgi:ABC-type dipeptide/oligopeptide/nickel transport system permease component
MSKSDKEGILRMQPSGRCGRASKKLFSIGAKLFAILLIMFLVIQIAPGGPIAQILAQLPDWPADSRIMLIGPLD